MKKIVGVLLIVVGVGSLGYWYQRSNNDRARMAQIADNGGISALTGDPKKIFLIGGIALIAAGINVVSGKGPLG